MIYNIKYIHSEYYLIMIFIVVFTIFYFFIFSEYQFDHSTVSNNCNLRTSMVQYIRLIGESIQNLREYVFIAMLFVIVCRCL